jgi:hypothetical protein
MKRRRRLPSSDQYLDDDIVPDGGTVRRPMQLCDAAMIAAIQRAYAPPRYHYGRGYLRDANTGAIIDQRRAGIVDNGPPPMPSAPQGGNLTEADLVYYREKDKLSDAWKGPARSGGNDHSDVPGRSDSAIMNPGQAQMRRDHAYEKMCADMQNEWKRKW